MLLTYANPLKLLNVLVALAHVAGVLLGLACVAGFTGALLTHQTPTLFSIAGTLLVVAHFLRAARS